MAEEREARDPSPDLEARQVFWSVTVDHIYRNHVAPRTKLKVPEDDFPRPLNYNEVQRQTTTSLDVVQEATIDDYWNIDGDKSLSEPWIGGTRFALPRKIHQNDIRGFKGD